MGGSAWTNQVQFLVIVAGPAGAGVFVYDPSAGAGNLIASLTDATADPYGNVTEKGVNSYVTYLGDKFAVGLNQVGPGGIPGLTILDTVSVPNVAAGVYGASAASGVAEAELHSGKVTAGDTFAAVAVRSATDSGITGGTVIITAGLTTVSGAITATGGTPASPTVITTDSWHNMSLLNGWSLGASGYAQYKLEPNNRVSVRGANIIPGTITGGTNVWTIPAGPPSYVPAVTARIVMDVEVSTGTPVTDTPRFDATTGGQFQCFNVPASTTRVGFNDSFALD